MTNSHPFFTDSEIEANARHRRDQLARKVRRASTATLRLLRSSRATPSRLLALSGREALHVDWGSGFINRCTIVVRQDGAPRGRLGLWESGGTLCLEAELGSAVIVLRGTDGELWIGEHDAELAALPSPAQLRALAKGALRGWRGTVTGVTRDTGSGKKVIRFRGAVRTFALT